MPTIALIPARCGSKSIPLKNIRPFCGKPLVYWNILALENTPTVDEIYVATDCDKIEKVVLGFGFPKTKVYRRKEENAQDTSSTEAVMLEFIDENKTPETTQLILVQATSPLTTNNDFTAALQKMDQGDSLLTCVRQKRFYWNPDGTAINYDFRNRPRRQDFDGQLMENGAFYINTVGNILRDKNRLSGKILIHEMEEYTAVEIDEPDDWIIAEKMMQKYILKPNSSKTEIKLFLTDVDGVLTDAGMYYSEQGDELKKFNTRDGKGLELLRNVGIKTGIITSENTELVSRRAKKLKVDHLSQGKHGQGKLDIAREICAKENIRLEETSYIGDDVNCMELLSAVGFAACPSDAVKAVQNIPGITVLEQKGGEGVVREFAEMVLKLNQSIR